MAQVGFQIRYSDNRASYVATCVVAPGDTIAPLPLSGGYVSDISTLNAGTNTATVNVSRALANDGSDEQPVMVFSAFSGVGGPAIFDANGQWRDMRIRGATAGFSVQGQNGSVTLNVLVTR